MVEIEVENDSCKSIPNSGEWKELMGDDLLFKVIARDRPRNNKDPAAIQPNDAVMIDFTVRIASDRTIVDGPIVQEAKDWFITVGDADVLPGMELAIRFMESGSKAHVWSHSKYAFSTGTRQYGEKKLPPSVNVMFEITVTQIVMDTSRLNPYFTIQKAISRKSIANDIYQHEWCGPPKSDTDPSCDAAMSRALRLYKKAAVEMETLLNGTYFNQVEKDHPQRHQITQVMLDSLNNIVAVYLRQKEYHKAKQSAIEVLQHDPRNIKGLLRAAKASLLDPASTMEEVKAALDAAGSEITYRQPQEEKELKRLQANFKKKKQEYKTQSRQMFGDKFKSSQSKQPAASSEMIEKTEPKLDETLKSEDSGVENWKRRFLFVFLQILIPLALVLLYKLIKIE